MLEVSKVALPDGRSFLKIELKVLNVDAIQAITSIPGWFKAPETMCYGLPYEALNEFKKKTKDYLVLWKNENDSMGSIVRGIDTEDLPNEYVVPYTPKIPLREHQVVAWNLLMTRDMLLVADQEGVGKAAPTICSVDAKIQYGLISWGLYVTKAGLIYDVKNQSEKFTNMKVVAISGTPKKRVKLYDQVERDKSVGMLVVSYETYRADLNHFIEMHRKRPFGCFVMDEAHKVKSQTSNLGKNIHVLDVPQKYAVTASPVINEVIDMHNILYWMGAIKYNIYGFKKRFCELDGWGNVTSYKNLSEIKMILSSNMLRRLKKDVLDLPPVIPKNIYVEMTPAQKKLYKAVDQGKLDELDFEDLEFEDVPAELAKHARLAQIAESTEIVGGPEGVKGSSKLKELEELVEEITHRGEKAIIFSRSKRFTHVMHKHFSKYNPAIITGDISASAKASQDISDRQQMVDKFQTDESCKLIICTEAASREGWTGTAANNIIFTSKPWSPAYTQQCIGRAWRFGQSGGNTSSINVYTLISKETVDERIEELLEEKQFLINSTVEQPLGTKQVLKVLDGTA